MKTARSAKHQNQGQGALMAKTITILSPLIIKTLKGQDESSFESVMLTQIDKLKECVSHAQNIINLPDDLPESLLLTEALSNFLADAGEHLIDEDAIGSILDAAGEFAESMPDIPCEEESLSLMVKTALFVPVIRLNEKFSCLGVDDQVIKGEIRKITDTAISICATLAFQWSKKSGVDHSRERLFVSVLPSALQLCEQAWAELFCESAPENRRSANPDSTQPLPFLHASIDMCDMGWKDSEAGVDGVCRQIEARMNNVIDRSKPQLWSPAINERIVQAMYDCLESISARAWDQACKRIAGEMEEMSEEQLASFADGEGSQPLRIERFDEEFDKIISQGWSIDLPEIDSLELASKARRKLVFLWGISDAACQTRLVSRL